MSIKKVSNMKEIGENLQKIRNFKGIKQKDAAELLGISPQYLSEIERGMHDISVGVLGKFGEAYEVNPGTFFGQNAVNAFNSYQQQGGHSNNYNILPSAASNTDAALIETLRKQVNDQGGQIERLIEMLEGKG